MFKQFQCHEYANEILNLFKPLFDYEVTDEKCNLYYLNKNYIYTASINNFFDIKNICLNIRFDSKREKDLALNPKIRLKMLEASPSIIKTDYDEFAKIIGGYLDKKYQADYENLEKVVDVFIRAGLKLGFFEEVDNKAYENTWASYIDCKPNLGCIHIGDYSKNMSIVTFNRIFQKGGTLRKKHFKKSYVAVSMEYLVNSKNELKPYFKISLPFTDEKKIHYYMALESPDKLYIVEKEKDIYIKYIEKFKSITLDINKIEKHFEKIFRANIEDIIHSLVRIDKDILSDMSIQELQEHFVLVDMIKN